MEQQDEAAFIAYVQQNIIYDIHALNEYLFESLSEEEKEDLFSAPDAHYTAITELQLGEQDQLHPYFVFGYVTGSFHAALYHIQNVRQFNLNEIKLFASFCEAASGFEGVGEKLRKRFFKLLIDYADPNDDKVIFLPNNLDEWT